jgi:peptide/nickel transport system permease protein
VRRQLSAYGVAVSSSRVGHGLNMVRYLIGRLAASLGVILALTLVVFGLVHLAGDPIVVMLQGTGASEQDLAALRAELGYDQPIHVQYWRFLKGLARGEMGRSLRYHVSALSVVRERAPATIQLAVVAMFIGVVVGIPLGIISALRPGTIVDHLATLVALIGQSVPGFWLGIVAVLLFAVSLGWLPAGGIGGAKHLVLPAVTLATFPMARLVRITRSSMLEVINADYITTARAKGVRERAVVLRHALKNACIPIVTIGGLCLGELLGGSVVTETIFSWPGLGLLTVQAVYARDLPLLQACVFVMSLGYLVCNLVVDLLYGFLDPRITYS